MSRYWKRFVPPWTRPAGKPTIHHMKMKAAMVRKKAAIWLLNSDEMPTPMPRKAAATNMIPK